MQLFKHLVGLRVNVDFAVEAHEDEDLNFENFLHRELHHARDRLVIRVLVIVELGHQKNHADQEPTSRVNTEGFRT